MIQRGRIGVKRTANARFGRTADFSRLFVLNKTTRISAQNFRKEFFRVSMDEVEAAVTRLAPGAPFFKDVEAQEYRETLARRNAMLAAAEPLAGC